MVNKSISPNFQAGTVKLGIYQPVPVHVGHNLDKLLKSYHS